MMKLRTTPATTTWASAALGALIGAALVVVPSASPAVTTAPTPTDGGHWLATQLTAHGDTLTGPSGSGTDWGLTIDALFALASTGSDHDVAVRTTARIAASGDAYTSSIAQKAKLALALQVAGLDPTKFNAGGTTDDLIADLRAEAAKNNDAGVISTSQFGQALGVIALARTATGVSAAVVNNLATFQCSTAGDDNAGGFGWSASGACGSADADATAMGLSALLAGGRTATDPAVVAAVGWASRHQAADGSFGGSTWSPDGNSNSSGLLGQALRGVGTAAAGAMAEKAGGFISTLQLTSGPSKGAIAYNADAYADASSATGIGDNSGTVDQWQRATAQAVLAWGGGFVGLSLTAPTPAATAATPSPTASASPTPAYVVTHEPPLSAKKLKVAVSKKRVKRGTRLAVVVRGLTSGEPYSITIAGRTVRTGSANSKGAVRAKVTVPRALRGKKSITLVVTGSTNKRIGKAKLKVVGR